MCLNDTRLCTLCGELKPIQAFDQNHARRQCKRCRQRRAYAGIRRWNEQNRLRAATYQQNHYARKKGATDTLTPEEFQGVWARSRGRCASCGTTKKLTVDHVVDIRDGGRHRPENLVILCRGCNGRKGNARRWA